MRIAIVCANYVEGKSYQENIWAEQLAKAGHEVRLFHVGASKGAVKTVAGPTGSYQSQAASAWKLPRSTFWSNRVHQYVREFNPELIVLCGDKTFCVRICRDAALAGVPLVSTYSENLAMHEFDWRKRGISMKQRAWAIGFILMRAWPIRVACRRSALIVGNTPQARTILARCFSADAWARIESKMIDMPLGFSPEHFSFDFATRQRVRSELGIAESDVVICASSHFNPVKEPGLRLLVDALRRAMEKNTKLRALLIGFSDAPESSATSRRIESQIESGPFAERFIKHPFAGRKRLCELFNAADIAYFARASISCQEALATGLVVCAANDGSLNHLVTMPDQGFFFRPGDEADLTEKLVAAAAPIDRQPTTREQFRRGLAEGSRWLGYDRIIAAILVEVQRRCDKAEGFRRHG